MMPQHLHRVAFGHPNLVADLLAKFSIPRRKLLIDFSSPNIAKKFHVGNFRSTYHGNFIQKISRLAGHDVVAVNYLGDWGQQFSLLAFYWMAVMDGQEGRVQRPDAAQWAQMSARQRVELLTQAYTAAHQMAKLNPTFADRARQLFLGMERTKIGTHLEEEETPIAVAAAAAGGAGAQMPSTTGLIGGLTAGDAAAAQEVDQALQLWQDWVETSRQYLEDFYARFDVHFDEWDGESAHAEAGALLVDQLIAEGKCERNADGMWIVKNEGGEGSKVIALRKSDGSNLYLNRDFAAIYARHRQHNADEYIYVVDRDQRPHFYHLKQLLRLRGDEELADRVRHFSYGRVIGLSTREGKNDSVDFLVEQGQRECLAQINKSHTKRVGPEEEGPLCMRLAQSQLVFELAKRNRDSDFTFSFRGAFTRDGSNAMELQEKYSRLHSLTVANQEHVQRLLGLDQNAIVKLRLEISEPAQKLARAIVDFDQVLHSSLQKLEPVPLTGYLLRLSSLVGRAMPALRVLGEPLALALPRMLLFLAAKRVLGEGMRLIGMEPVEKM